MHYRTLHSERVAVTEPVHGRGCRGSYIILNFALGSRALFMVFQEAGTNIR
jgi:hypothetical protein